ncbi:hypothetical protein JNK13_06030 [bacterium]|nr:hypothetical protein [bacterium]
MRTIVSTYNQRPTVPFSKLLAAIVTSKIHITPEERHWMIYVGQGYSTKEIANMPEFCVSKKTGEFHLTGIYGKLKDAIQIQTGIRLKRFSSSKMITWALASGTIFARDLYREDFKFIRPSKLTKEERSVLEALMKGWSDQEIAELPGMEKSRGTVQFHTANLRKKFGVHNRLQLLQVAIHLWMEMESQRESQPPVLQMPELPGSR